MLPDITAQNRQSVTLHDGVVLVGRRDNRKVRHQPHPATPKHTKSRFAKGIDKRLDVLATAILGGMTIEDLCHLELAYAPPFGASRDAINLAGFAACNSRDGLVKNTTILPTDPQVQVVDVRPKPLADTFPAPVTVINIPYPTLRASLGKLDPSRPVVTLCAFGKMSYFAARILTQNGFDVTSFSGGLRANVDPRSPAKMATS